MNAKLFRMEETNRRELEVVSNRLSILETKIDSLPTSPVVSTSQAPQPRNRVTDYFTPTTSIVMRRATTWPENLSSLKGVESTYLIMR